MELNSSFEDDLRDAVLANAEHHLIGKYDNVVWTSIEASHNRLEQADYDTESVIESLEGPVVDDDGDAFTITWRWSHEAADYLERGTSPHRIDGDPVLSFVWENPPGWVTDEFDQARGSGGRFESGYRVFFDHVNVSGVDEIRYARAGLRVLRHELET